MKSSVKDIKLASVDDLFSTEQERQEAQGERIVRLPLSEMHYFKGYPALKSDIPFSGQPYKVRDDDPKMLETLESVKQRGVLIPGLVRPDPEGGYEIIAGHRRHRASELAELTDMPVIIREMNDEKAVIELVDANIQREDVLPSEKAWAYRMKLEAMRRQAGRPQKDKGAEPENALQGKKSRDVLAEQAGESPAQIQRIIRLTELTPELLQMVDDKKIAFGPAVELSYLKKEEQVLLLDAITKQDATPSLSQAQRLKKYSQDGKLDANVIDAIMTEEKKEVEKVTLQGDRLKKYFPKSYTPKQMEDTIFKLLEQWQHRRQQEQSR